MAKTFESESKLINLIGSGTTIKGDIETNGDIRIDGNLKGNIKANGKVVIGNNGKVEGEINCKSSEIHGALNGKITVDELLSLKQSCKAEGEILTKQLQIEPGAHFSGNCNMKDQTMASNYPGKDKDKVEKKP